MLLIFDVSGSMQTETEGRTRLQYAKEEALQLIRSLPAEEEITVLAALYYYMHYRHERMCEGMMSEV